VAAGPVAVRHRPSGGGRAPDANAKGRRLDEKRPLTGARQSLAERREQDAIGGSKAWASNLTREHLQLMSKNEDLHLFRPLVATEENQQLEQAANRPVQKEQDREQQ
jgi:hypothetical protein